MKTISDKEKAYTAARGVETRFKVAGIPNEFYRPEYVQALEAQDIKRAEEIIQLKTMLKNAESIIQKISAELGDKNG